MRPNMRLLRAAVHRGVGLHMRSRSVTAGRLSSVVQWHGGIRLLGVVRVTAVGLLAVGVGR